MRISIIGCGYVGTVTGIGFAELGNHITFVDVDQNKINKLNSERSPIFELGLDELIKKNGERVHATTDISEIKNSDISFICVGTPSSEDGSIDLDYIKSATKDIGKAIRNKTRFHLVVVKSTVLPGTTEEVIIPILERILNERNFGVAMNPEFLREGNAVDDFFNPDKIVFGSDDERAKRILEELYKPFNCPKLCTNIKTAEMIKYACNSFLSAKISFANEIGNICKTLGIDTYNVFKGVGLDHRINPAYFRAGIGFGGSCFPKDIKALIAKAEMLGECPKILSAVVEVNEGQPLKMINLLRRHVPDLRGIRIGVLGLTFKPNTNDIRESRAVLIVEKLINEGANVIAYDPQGMDLFKRLFPQVEYTSPKEVLNAQAVLIVTEWQEFESLDYSGRIVIDGRRVAKAKDEAAIYEGVCW